MFAKIFDTPHGQLLAFMDTEDDEPVIVVKGEAYKGVLASASLSGWKDEEVGQQREFDEIDQAKAEDTAKFLRSALVKLMGEEDAE
jgi:hypothetical protein